MFFFHFFVRADKVCLYGLYGSQHDVEPPPLCFINELKKQQTINIFQELILVNPTHIKKNNPQLLIFFFIIKNRHFKLPF